MTMFLVISILMLLTGIFIVRTITKNGETQETQGCINVGCALIIIGLFFTIAVILVFLNII